MQLPAPPTGKAGRTASSPSWRSHSRPFLAFLAGDRDGPRSSAAGSLRHHSNVVPRSALPILAILSDLTKHPRTLAAISMPRGTKRLDTANWARRGHEPENERDRQ